MPLDHSNASDARKFELRYFQNPAEYEYGGPIVVLVGGVELQGPESLVEGPVSELVRQLRADSYFVEQRYTGVSVPFRYLSVEKLRFNTVANQIGDLAEFIRVLKRDRPHAKIVLVGVSYSGALAAWLKTAYPALVDAAWISSPLLEAKADISELRDSIGERFRKVGGDSCFEKIEKGFNTMGVQIWANQTHLIEEAFGLCSELSIPKDTDLLFHILFEIFLKVSLESERFIGDVCVDLESIFNPVEAVALVLEPLLPRQFCLDINYERYVEELRDPITQDTSRASLYLACSELGWFSPALEENQAFGSRPSMSFYSNLCRDVFDEGFNLADLQEKTKKINEKYGGKTAKLEKVFVSVGEEDPLRVLGPLGADVFKIPGATHGNDLLSAKFPRTEALEAAQKTAIERISGWLEEEKLKYGFQGGPKLTTVY